MRLVGRSVVFRLSPEGQQALGGIFPQGDSFPALVIDQDELGLSVTLEGEEVESGEEGAIRSVPVILLKWHYFSTATLNYFPQAPAARVQEMKTTRIPGTSEFYGDQT